MGNLPDFKSTLLVNVQPFSWELLLFNMWDWYFSTDMISMLPPKSGHEVTRYRFWPRDYQSLNALKLNRLIQEGPKSTKAKFSGEGKNNFIQKCVNSFQLFCD